MAWSSPSRVVLMAEVVTADWANLSHVLSYAAAAARVAHSRSSVLIVSAVIFPAPFVSTFIRKSIFLAISAHFC